MSATLAVFPLGLTVAPVGPVGTWKAASGSGGGGDESLLSRFDPFFRGGATSGPAVVTSLAIKLFGVRVDQAMGRGSAIIATPDEKVVYSWIEWPSKEVRDKGWEEAMKDPRMKDMKMPFDGKRMIYGGFAPILDR